MSRPGRNQERALLELANHLFGDLYAARRHAAALVVLEQVQTPTGSGVRILAPSRVAKVLSLHLVGNRRGIIFRTGDAKEPVEGRHHRDPKRPAAAKAAAGRHLGAGHQQHRFSRRQQFSYKPLQQLEAPGGGEARGAAGLDAGAEVF